jgi:ABC-2 type transport system permease protein
MKSKTSSINTGILLNDLKRFSWIGAGYLLALLAIVPLKIFMLYSRTQDLRINDTTAYLRIFQFDYYSPIQILVLIVVPVLTGLLLFRYLQDGRAADMAHALPVRREALYNTHVVTGIIFLFVPLILTALVSWALVSGLGIEDVNGINILTWLANCLLLNLLFFICSVAVGMVTGMTTMQGVLSYILLFLPSGLSILLLHNLNQYVYGFAYDYYLSSKIEYLSPLTRLTDISRNPFQPGEMAVYLGISILLYFVGRSFYLRRNTETAGSAITFQVLRPVFKYSVTFCFMLLLGSYFNAVQDSMAWTYFGYLIGSLMAYFLIEILLNKSLQVFQGRQFRNYGIYALAMVVLLGLLHFDWTGYEKRLPGISEIKSIYMDSSYYPLTYQPANVPAAQAVDYMYTPAKAIFTDQDNIARIHALHRQIIANGPDHQDSSLSKGTRNTQRICLAYELAGGKRMYRQYQIPIPDYTGSLKPIYESREYKELHNQIFSVNPAEVDFIDIYGFEADKNLRLVDPELIAQAFAVLKTDIYAETYEEMVNINGKPPWANVNIHIKNLQDRSFSQDWKKTYTNFEQWLKDTGKYEQIRLLPGTDITCAFIDRVSVSDDKELQGPYAKTRRLDLAELEDRPGILKITDPEQMEWCLRQYYRNGEQADYEIFFVRNNGDVISGFLGKAGAPAFIQEHFAG